MNPTLPASAVIVTDSSIGMQSAALVVLGIIVVLLVLTVIKMKFPGSAAKVTAWVDGEMKTFATRAEADLAALKSRAESEASVLRAQLREAESKIAPTIETVESKVRSEAQTLLEDAERWLTNTTAEDDIIARANNTIVEQNSRKAVKLATLDEHIAKLQAYRSGVASGS